VLDTCRVHASINTGASSPLTPCTRPAAASAARCSGRTAPPVRLFATVAAACPRGLDPFRPTEKLKLDHRRRAVVDVIVDRRTFGVEPERRRRAVQWSPAWHQGQRPSPWACEPCPLSEPHVLNPMAIRDPGVDGISFTVHPRSACRLHRGREAASAACLGSPERRRAGQPVWDDFQRPFALCRDREG